MLMCHPDATGSEAPPARRTDTEIKLPDGASMGAFVASPPAETPTIGSVLVIGDIWGARTPFYEDLAARLAGAGFEAVVPEYFHRVGPLPEATYEGALARKAKLAENQALEDLEQVIDSQQAKGHSPRMGVLGCCLGGTFALDLAAERQGLATVCFYGFPAGSPGPEELVAATPLHRSSEISDPLRGFWGGLDQRVGIDNVNRLISELDQRQVDFEGTILPGLDHGFLPAAFDPQADGHATASGAWDQTVTFLRSAASKS